MSDFDQAVEYVLANEGGLSDHPRDPGGITNFGITLGTLRREIPEAGPDDIRRLTREEAKGIYLRLYWDDWKFDKIVDQRVANKFFDLAVNTGHYQATLVIQRAINRCGGDLVVDGIFGQKTLIAINLTPWMFLMGWIKAEALSAYLKIIDNKPRLGTFLLGWMRRTAREPMA